LCEQVAADLRRKGYLARTIGVKLTYVGFSKVTRDLTLDSPTDEARAIRRAAGLCLKRVDLTRRFRLLGVRASKLVKPGTAEHAAATQNAPQPKPRDKAPRDEHTDLLFPELD
jgi:DNA polymerase-4